MKIVYAMQPIDAIPGTAGEEKRSRKVRGRFVSLLEENLRKEGLTTSYSLAHSSQFPFPYAKPCTEHLSEFFRVQGGAVAEELEELYSKGKKVVASTLEPLTKKMKSTKARNAQMKSLGYLISQQVEIHVNSLAQLGHHREAALRLYEDAIHNTLQREDSRLYMACKKALDTGAGFWMARLVIPEGKYWGSSHHVGSSNPRNSVRTALQHHKIPYFGVQVEEKKPIVLSS